MKRLDLAGAAALAEIIGTAGIIVSLIFVALSINSNTTEAKASQLNSLYGMSREIELIVASDPEWIRSILEGRNGSQQMSEIDLYRYDIYLISVLDLWDEMQVRDLDGLMDQEDIDAWDDYFGEWSARYITDVAWQRIEWNAYNDHIVATVEAAISSR